MAFEPENAEKRRFRRKLRQKILRNRRLLLAVGVIAVTLVVGILFLVLGGDAPKASTGAHPDDTVIHLAAAGDLSVTDGVVDSGTGDYNYTQTFMDVGYLLGKADVSVLNFEGNLVGAPYGTKYASAPNSLMQALDAVGVDLIQLANSYSIYNGMSGLRSTIEGVRAAGMEPLGVYPDGDAFRKSGGYTICDVKGVRIAFVAFTKGMDGMTLPDGMESCVNLLYTDYNSGYQQVDTEKIDRILDNVDKAKPDLVVAMVHWGSEFNNTISTSQKQICEQLQERGVDAIIGTHSHYLQAMSLEDGKFVAYSLGDFYSEPSRSGSEYSVVLDLEITKSAATGKTKITDFSYTPIYRDNSGNKLQLMRLEETITAYEGNYLGKVSKETYESLLRARESIKSRIETK
ncbi:MAG: CapA family protein [Oscillospiraceae bacterium]|nr:CapA family protein [Oscillospiraceae bacterium]